MRLVGGRGLTIDARACRFAGQMGKPALSYLWDHRVRGRALLAGAALMEAAFASAAMLNDDSVPGQVSLGGINFVGALILPQHFRWVPARLEPGCRMLQPHRQRWWLPGVTHLANSVHDTGSKALESQCMQMLRPMSKCGVAPRPCSGCNPSGHQPECMSLASVIPLIVDAVQDAGHAESQH